MYTRPHAKNSIVIDLRSTVSIRHKDNSITKERIACDVGTNVPTHFPAKTLTTMIFLDCLGSAWLQPSASLTYIVSNIVTACFATIATRQSCVVCPLRRSDSDIALPIRTFCPFHSYPYDNAIHCICVHNCFWFLFILNIVHFGDKHVCVACRLRNFES